MKSIRLLLVGLILGGMVVCSGVASAAGYPFVVVDTSVYPTIVVGKFASGAGQFTQTEAENLVQSIVAAVEGQDLVNTSTASVLTPSQLAGLSINGHSLSDGDYVKNLVKQNYVDWGLGLYIFLDVRKKAEYSAGFGNNVRIDVYVADMASLLGISADYLYALSIETPAMYVSLLQL